MSKLETLDMTDILYCRFLQEFFFLTEVPRHHYSLSLTGSMRKRSSVLNNEVPESSNREAKKGGDNRERERERGRRRESQRDREQETH